jgi:hypothetical protein
MASWPAFDRCKGHLHELVSSHNIQPLPAYDENHNLIPPSQYESKLKGAVVEVHMAICHHHIKSSKRDIRDLARTYCPRSTRSHANQPIQTSPPQ